MKLAGQGRGADGGAIGIVAVGRPVFGGGVARGEEELDGCDERNDESKETMFHDEAVGEL
jgi:hypothetical protein